ncbi:MAG: hypothetical protein AAF317_20815 [Pseudomonadota bacterium]
MPFTLTTLLRVPPAPARDRALGVPLTLKRLRLLPARPKLFIRLNSRDNLFRTSRCASCRTWAHAIRFDIHEVSHDIVFLFAPAEPARGLKEIAVILAGERRALFIIPLLSISQEPNWVPVRPTNIPQTREVTLRPRHQWWIKQRHFKALGQRGLVADYPIPQGFSALR